MAMQSESGKTVILIEPSSDDSITLEWINGSTWRFGISFELDAAESGWYFVDADTTEYGNFSPKFWDALKLWVDRYFADG